MGAVASLEPFSSHEHQRCSIYSSFTQPWSVSHTKGWLRVQAGAHLSIPDPRRATQQHNSCGYTLAWAEEALFETLEVPSFQFPPAGHHLCCPTPGLALTCSFTDHALSSDFLRLKWEYFLQGRPEADEPWVSLCGLKMEEKKKNTMHRFGLLTVEGPEVPSFMLQVVENQVCDIQTRLKVLGEGGGSFHGGGRDFCPSCLCAV